MGSLTDKQFQSYRRTSPGRTVKRNPDDGTDDTTELQEYSVAVVGGTGELLTSLTATELLTELILETRRTNMLLEMEFSREVSLSDVA